MDDTHPALSLDVPIVVYIDAAVKGGTAGYGVALARGLRQHGHRVAAICHTAEAVAPMREQLRQAGVDVYALDVADPSPREKVGLVRAFASVIRRYPGCVLALMMGYFSPGAHILTAGALAGAEVVVRADLQPPLGAVSRRSRVTTFLKDLLVDRIVVGAIENRETFARALGRPERMIDVVHTGIDLRRFAPAPDQRRVDVRAGLGYRPEQIVVGSISRLDEEATRKGVDYFIAMAAQVARVVPDAQFLVVGDGVLRPRLERQAEALGVRQRVTFAGWRTDVPELLAALDVFVMPSLAEGGPTTVLEAMATGVPVVATSVGMVPEVVEHGVTGMIVPPADARALAQAAGVLLSDAALREAMGRRAYAKAQRDFSIETMVERYLDVFARAYTRRAGRRLPGAPRLTRVFA
jgi:glycosyltransferase involved in cell wall biosynthesis